MAGPEVSLRTAASLREEADRVSRAAGGGGDARRRFLERERARVARALTPLAGLFSILFSGSLALEVAGARRLAILLPLALGAVASAVTLLLVPVLRKRAPALHALALALPFTASLALAGSAREDSAYFVFVLLVLVAAALSLPLGPALAAALGGVFPVAIVVAHEERAPHAWLAFVLFAGFAFLWARVRRRRVLMSFRRAEKLRMLVQRLRRTQEDLVIAEKLEALRVLVGGIAHELNNALAVSQVSLDAARKAEPPRAMELVEKASGGLGRIKRTVDRLRRFAMAADDDLEPADIAAMLDFALESAIGRARSGVVVERRYDVEVGTVQCHVSALAEALFQISKNAVEAMPKGGTITARVTREGENVVLSVEDEGAGIDEKHLARVFDPYFTKEKPQSIYTTLGGGKARGGAGMGLSAVYGLVSALGGSVKIKSEPGKGTRVAIFLPRRG